MQFDYAEVAMNSYAVATGLALVAMIVILAIFLIRERSFTRRILKKIHDQNQNAGSNPDQNLEFANEFQRVFAAEQSAAKSNLGMNDEGSVTAANAGPMDLPSRVVTLEGRVAAIDSLLVGLLMTLMKSQPALNSSDPAVEDTARRLQELEAQLQAIRRQNSALKNIAMANGQNKEKIAAIEAGISAEEHNIGNLLRRLATL
jgi:hypothetical protein